jgi:hypothetical protein
MKRFERAPLFLLGVLQFSFSASPAFADEPPMPPHNYHRCSQRQEFCLQADTGKQRMLVFRKQKRPVVPGSDVWIIPAYAQNAEPSPDGKTVAALDSCLVEGTEMAFAKPLARFWMRNGNSVLLTYHQLMGKRPITSLPKTASHRQFCQTYGFQADGRFMIETVFRGKIYFNPQTAAQVNK